MNSESLALEFKIKQAKNEFIDGTGLINQGFKMYEETLDYQNRNNIDDRNVGEMHKINSIKEYSKNLIRVGSSRQHIANLEVGMYCRQLRNIGDENIFNSVCNNVCEKN